LSRWEGNTRARKREARTKKNNDYYSSCQIESQNENVKLTIGTFNKTDMLFKSGGVEGGIQFSGVWGECTKYFQKFNERFYLKS